ncbi:hypothetical protein Tco_0312579 [Tanacetum coccineum]
MLRQSEAEVQQLRTEKEFYTVEAGRGEMVWQRIMNQYLVTFVRRLHQSDEYKWSFREVFSLAVGKGFIGGVSIGRSDVDVRAILEATPNVDPAASDTFMDAYEKLFDRRYPYVDKVARIYLLDPSGLQNIMPDETGPTPGGVVAPYHGKGKEKVGVEQAAQVLLNLQTPKKKSPADYETESDEEVLPVIQSGAQDEGRAGPNPAIQDEGQAGSNLGDATVSQHQSSHVVHAGPNLEHIDFEVTDTSIQQNPEQMDEEFTTTAYPNVQENLKLPIEDRFLVEKSPEDEPEKNNIESEVQSMITVPIHQDTSFVPLMTTPIIDLMVSQPVSTTIQALLPTSTATVTTITTTTSLPPIPPQPQQSSSYSILIQRIGELEQHMVDMVEANQDLEERLDKQGNRLYNLENLDVPHKVSKAMDKIVTDAVDWTIQAPLRDRFKDLPEADMKEILHHRIWESNSYQAHEDYKIKKKKRHDSPKTPPGSPPHQPPPPPPPVGSSGTPGASGSSQLPPPPSPSTNQSDQSKSTAALSSSKTAASAEYTAWTTTNSRLKQSVSSIPEDLHMDADLAPDEQVYLSDDEDIGHDHIPKVNLKQDWWKPLSEEDIPATPEPTWSIPSSDLPVPTNNLASAFASTYAPPPENSLLAQTGDMATFMNWYCKRQGLTELSQKDLEGPAFEIVKIFHPDVIHLQYQMEECHKLLTDQVDDAILRYNVSKPLPLGGPQGQVTIQSDFCFNKDLEYLRYGSRGSRPALCGLKKNASMTLLLCTVSLTSGSKDNDSTLTDTHLKVIAEVYGLICEFLMLSELKSSPYMDSVKPHQTRWDATGFEYKHDFTVIDSPRAVTFRDKYGVQMIMLFNEIHKFSDGTLQQIDEALDYRVKEFKKRLKTRRIFRNLESFVGGRIREGDYRLLQRTE